MKRFFFIFLSTPKYFYPMAADWVMEVSFYTPTAQEILQEKQKNYDELLAHVQDCIVHKKNMDEIFSVNPLHLAAADDFYLPITQLLLLNNADPNRRDLLGKTPFNGSSRTFIGKNY